MVWSCTGSPGSGTDAVPEAAGDAGADVSGDAGPDARAAAPFDWCVPDAAPDAECYASKRDPSSSQVALALAIARKQMALRPAAERPWKWEDAVLMIALVELFRVTGDEDVQAYYKAWMDHHIEAGYSIGTSDTCVPAAVAVALHQQTGEAKYEKVVQDALKYLYETATRTSEGGISHLGTVDIVTLWVDSLFMFGSVLLGAAEAEGDDEALAEFGTQLGIFTDLMQDDSGFYVHAYDWIMDQTPGVFWARGNGWVSAAGYDYLRLLVNRNQSDAEARAALDRLTAAVMGAQDPDTGLWWSIMTKPGKIYLETSGSALFAYGMARGWRYGNAGDEVLPSIAAAMSGVLGRITVGLDGAPTVSGISGPTSADAYQAYADVPLEDDLPYGLGAVILALVETSGLPLPEVPVQGPWNELPPGPSDGFLDRKAQMLQACSDAGAPPLGGLYAQVCRVVTGQTEYSQAAFDAAFQKLAERKDTADFSLAALVRVLYLDKEQKVLPDALRKQITDTVLGFRFWLTEPGDDKMCYWTENHQALFHSGELLAGQLFPEVVFGNDGKTGAEHAAHARPLVLRWLELRATLGFSEWHSNVYFNEDMPALVNLADFADDPEIRTRAAIVLDILAIDMLSNYYKGLFATTHGRTYESHFLGGLSDSTAAAAWLMTGLGAMEDAGNFSGAFIATSTHYYPSPLLETFAADAAGSFEHRQRDSVDVKDGPAFGIGYTATEDVVFWAGMAALVVPEVVEGTVAMLDQYDLWTGFLFGDIPEPYLSMLKQAAATPGGLVQLATDMEPVARGIALESVNTVTWRTPDYQISGAQSYKPGYWGSQTQAWQATLSKDAFVFTSFPGDMGSLGPGMEFGGTWIGGWLPRFTMHRNVAVVQYRATKLPLLDEYLTTDHTHAFFPRPGFDEVREEAGWLFGRKGDGYVALLSENPGQWSADNDYEWDAPGKENTWIVEMGSKADDGTFDDFVSSVSAAAATFGDEIVYVSPSAGIVRVSWDGPMTVDGTAVDLGPFPRFANPHVLQPFGSTSTVLTLGSLRLSLDFEKALRRELSK